MPTITIDQLIKLLEERNPAMEKKLSKYNFSVGDVIRLPAFRGGYRVWRVTAVNIGGTYVESCVQLETLDLLKQYSSCCVPWELLEAAMEGGAIL